MYIDNVKVIKTMNTANVLLERGNKIVHIDRDKNNKDYLIFLFDKTDKLLTDLNEVTKLEQQQLHR